MTSRRDFIRHSALAAGAVTLPSGLYSMSPNPSPLSGTANKDLYWKQIRTLFPLTDERIFLNNGTMGPSPYPVIQATYDAAMVVEKEAQYGGWEETAKVLSTFIGSEEDELAMTRNVTEGINIVCWGLPLKRGDEVIISNHEHVGNALPWLNRARVDGLKLKVVDLSLPTDQLLETIERSINKHTRVIALPHVPCTTGRVLPVKKIAEIAKRKNLIYFVDGAHGAGMLDLNLHDLDCDFYASCCHKWLLGPKGTGFLYIRKDKLHLVDPRFVGGYSDDGWDMLSEPPVLKGFVQTASRNFYGTQNASIYKGVAAAVKFHEAIGKKAVVDRIRELSDELYQQLLKMPQVTLLTPADERAGMVSFIIAGKNYQDFQKVCNEKSIVIRGVPENNVNCVRVSTHIYNSSKDIQQFVAILQDYIAI